MNSDEEVVVKVVREVLNLVEIVIDPESAADYAALSIVNQEFYGQPVSVTTEVILERLNGSVQRFVVQSAARNGEKPSAARNRLVKRNLYRLLRAEFSFPKAPWGILHGVRPTKIVHRLLREGLDEAAILALLREDYDVSEEKAEELLEVAVHERSFLERTTDRTISVYVGIPFCLTRCLYCSFPSNVLPNDDKLQEFMDVLKKDIAATREEIKRYGFQVQSIYIGGGTPTSLPDKFFAEMLQMVYNAFWNEEVLEFTVEAGRPDSMSAEKARMMKRLAVTRVSVNPQTMQDTTLKRIGRAHTSQQIVEMYHTIRAIGIPSINMDIILGLPGETTADVVDTVEKVLALNPDDITIHALALKRGSYLKMNLSEVDLPSDEEAIAMFEAATKLIKKSGMKPYYLYRQGYMRGGLENIGYAHEGAESWYNIQIMEENQTILGVGGAAVTKVIDVHEHRLKSAFHAKDLVTYLRDVDYYIEKRRSLLENVYANA